MKLSRPTSSKSNKNTKLSWVKFLKITDKNLGHYASVLEIPKSLKTKGSLKIKTKAPNSHRGLQNDSSSLFKLTKDPWLKKIQMKNIDIFDQFKKFQQSYMKSSHAVSIYHIFIFKTTKWTILNYSTFTSYLYYWIWGSEWRLIYSNCI